MSTSTPGRPIPKIHSGRAASPPGVQSAKDEHPPRREDRNNTRAPIPHNATQQQQRQDLVSDETAITLHAVTASVVPAITEPNIYLDGSANLGHHSELPHSAHFTRINEIHTPPLNRTFFSPTNPRQDALPPDIPPNPGSNHPARCNFSSFGTQFHWFLLLSQQAFRIHRHGHKHRMFGRY